MKEEKPVIVQQDDSKLTQLTLENQNLKTNVENYGSKMAEYQR